MVAVLALAALPGPASAQRGITLLWTPARPIQGSLVRLVAVADSGATDSILAIRGDLAGEPLHFERAGTRRLVAYGGVPADWQANLKFPLVVQYATHVDTIRFEMPVYRAVFGSERLSVAPEFTEKPDSALQARIDHESRQIAVAWSRAHQTPRLWQGRFARPRTGRITSPFGTGREFNGIVQNRHLGLDFDGSVGDSITASSDGIVVLVGDFYYSGRCVFVDHGAGFSTAYLHMSEVLVAAGDTVKQGQLIGRVGATGRVTGPHLHWIAKYGRISVNPMSLLRLEIK
ncbi:MAG: M23 family metallopeptidase [Gemmatimonadetes bacterium]|nr:M23 family metallopeptidase [Gemmatimonadota bacterium]